MKLNSYNHKGGTQQTYLIYSVCNHLRMILIYHHVALKVQLPLMNIWKNVNLWLTKL
jgi:hypothetical protein